jgi:hypothetical protein
MPKALNYCFNRFGFNIRNVIYRYTMSSPKGLGCLITELRITKMVGSTESQLASYHHPV